ncbi:MAG: hypothetical protein JWO51_1027 [Rhodospirillales bacterium]|nr:hypothetical protein [Rhodospirillales bacterium]
MIVIWIVIALFAVGDTAAGLSRNPPPATLATASTGNPSEPAP